MQYQQPFEQAIRAVAYSFAVCGPLRSVVFNRSKPTLRGIVLIGDCS